MTRVLDDIRQHWRLVDLFASALKAYDESEHPRDDHGRWTDSGGGDAGSLPVTAADIDPNKKVTLGVVYRGTEAGISPEEALRFSDGDIGRGIYLTQSKEIASSYGGGPNASTAAGTRIVHVYKIAPMYPEDVVFVFGGAKIGSEVTLVSGTGIELWRGEWNEGKNVEAVLSKQDGIKAVIGTNKSIGLNQIAIRDRSVIKVDVLKAFLSW